MLDKPGVTGSTTLAVLELSCVILCYFALLLKENVLSEKKIQTKESIASLHIQHDKLSLSFCLARWYRFHDKSFEHSQKLKQNWILLAIVTTERNKGHIGEPFSLNTFFMHSCWASPELARDRFTSWASLYQLAR